MWRTVYENVRELVERYGNYIPAGALLFGLIWDSLTLQRPDSLFENAVVAAYLILAAGIIVVLNVRRARMTREQEADPNTLRPVLLLGVLQFAFGNLTSALLILYIKSGAVIGSLFFFGALGALLVGNEFLRSRYQQTYLHVLVWYVLLLAYATLIVPVIVGSIGDMIFLLSVAIATMVAAALLWTLYTIARTSFVPYVQRIGTTLSIAALVFIGLYFTGGIPPVPLSSQHIGIYHEAERTEDAYRLVYEEPRWYNFWRDTRRTIHADAGEPLFCFSAVYAPKNIQTTIFHRWEYYDDAQGTWQTAARIQFPISGGRKEGFRGYTQTSQITPGKWRCSVETARGALVGRTGVTVVPAEEEPALEVREL